jgi:hypothetical protein
MSRLAFVNDIMPMLLALETQSLDFKSLSPKLSLPFQLVMSGSDGTNELICPVKVAFVSDRWRYDLWYRFYVASIGPVRNIRCARTSTNGKYAPNIMEICEVSRYDEGSPWEHVKRDNITIGRYTVSYYTRRMLPRKICFYCNGSIGHAVRHFRSYKHNRRRNEVIDGLAIHLNIPQLCMVKIMAHLDYEPMIPLSSK